MRGNQRREVVISGVAGSFPGSENIDEFRENLFNKKYMVSSESCRWTPDAKLDVPNCTGTIKNSTKFDALHFGIHRKLANVQDPMTSLILEKAFEAVMDAGINPGSLKGTKTSVVMTTSISESDILFDFFNSADGFGIMGHNRSMVASRVSYYLDVKGPCYAALISEAGGIHALALAYEKISTGACDAMIIGAPNLTSFKEMSWVYKQLGLLSPDGVTRSFDAAANGYGRSEAVVVMFLQCKEDAKRVYADVLHANVCCYGDRKDFVSLTQQAITTHLQDFYDECGVDPEEVSYLEADGSASKNNDSNELNAIDQVMLKNRKTPLLVGSVKSNIGNTEAAASICSLAKVLVAMETGIIPPNLNYSTPLPDVPALRDGRIQIVTEAQPWSGGLMAVNSLGIDGNCGHALLRSHNVKRPKTTDDIPRLVVVSSRTEQNVNDMLTKIESMPIDHEFIKLLHDIHATNVQNHLYRGYTIVGSDVQQIREVQSFEGEKRPVWFIFSGMGSQWPGMARHLMQLPVFAETIDKCQPLLEEYGLDLKHIITTDDPTIFDNILHSFVGITAVQVALVDMLNRLGIKPDGMIGHSLGELGCSYADGCSTLEEMILTAYSRGMSSIETKLVPGTMAAIGLSHQEAQRLCPPEVDVACHNGPTNCTISGPKEVMDKFVNELKAKGVFARLVNVSNIAYHSRYIAPAGPTLLARLKKIFLKSKPRSARWISTSIPESNWNTDMAKYASAEYHANNLLRPVLFEEGCCFIPNNAICIEIGPHGLLQAILRQSLSSGCTNISLTKRGHERSLHFLFQAIGKLYMLGLQPNLAEIFPAVMLPVSRGTPAISSLTQWEHSENWELQSSTMFNLKPGDIQITLALTQEDTHIYSNYQLGGQVVLPPTAYLKFAWDVLASIRQENAESLPVVFENVIFHQPVYIPKQGSTELYLMLQRGSGNFEVLMNGQIVTSGQVIVPEDIEKEFIPSPRSITTAWSEFSTEDVYKEFKQRGYQYTGVFQGIKSVKLSRSDSVASIKWYNNWVAFTDLLFQLNILQTHEHSQDLQYPSFLRKLIVDTKQLNLLQGQEVEATFDYKTNVVRCNGIEVRGLRTKALVTSCEEQLNFQLDRCIFVKHNNPDLKIVDEFIALSLQLALENYIPTKKSFSHVTVLEINEDHSLKSYVQKAAEHLLPTEVVIQSVTDSTVNEMEQNIVLVLATEKQIKTAMTLIGDSGAFLLVKVMDSIVWQPGHELNVITEYHCGGNRLLLLKKAEKMDRSSHIVVIEDNNKWLDKLRQAEKSRSTNSKNRIYLVSHSEPPCGIPSFLGKLTQDYNTDCIRCVFILDKSAPEFSLSNRWYCKQLALDLSVNVYLNGQWGTYHKLPLQETLNQSSTASVAPLRLEGIDVHYMAMTNVDSIDCVANSNKQNNDTHRYHLEFSGITHEGKRVMGIANQELTEPLQHLTWPVPESWSLEDAITVPLTYASAYYVLQLLGNLKTGDSVLVHMGQDIFSQAAITIALSMGCNVFTTVPSPEQRMFVKKHFPQIHDDKIMDIDSLLFEARIKAATGNKGVTMIISSLTGDINTASLRCLEVFGHMVQLGPRDEFMNHYIGMLEFLKGVALYGVSTENVVNATTEWKKRLYTMVLEGIASGVVKPLERNVFPLQEADKAIQLLSANRHSNNKIVLNLSAETKKKDIQHHKNEEGKFKCNSESSYLIFGGRSEDWLGLAQWLVKRGARKLVIAQQSQPISNYIARQLSILQTYHAVKVTLLSSHQASTHQNASNLICEVNACGPLAAIFILPLNDESKWDRRTHYAISNLDAASRSCQLQHFVCLMCHAAQQVCEIRRQQGLPALALLPGTCSEQAGIRDILLNMDELLTTSQEPVIMIDITYKETDTIAKQLMVNRINSFLPKTIRDLMELGTSLKRGENVVEVVSLNPGLSTCKEVSPVFILPGLQYTSEEALHFFTSRIMYPTLVLKMTQEANSIEEYAAHLLQTVRETYPSGPYILLGNLYGGVVALELARQLENLGQRTQVFLLDGIPQTIQDIIHQLGEGVQLESNILCKLFNLSSHKINDELNSLPNWESRLNYAMSYVPTGSDQERMLILSAVNAIHSHLNALLCHKSSHQITSPVTLIKPYGAEDYFDLTKLCRKTVNVHQVGKDNRALLESEETSDIINSTVIIS